MRVLLDVEIKGFSVPNFVIPVQRLSEEKEDATQSYPSIPLRDISPQMLHELCVNFRRDVFNKAGKPDPEIFK